MVFIWPVAWNKTSISYLLPLYPHLSLSVSVSTRIYDLPTQFTLMSNSARLIPILIPTDIQPGILTYLYLETRKKEVHVEVVVVVAVEVVVVVSIFLFWWQL